MPALRFLNLLAVALVAIVALSPNQVDALVADRFQVARHVHAHDAIARRKRDGSSGQCKPRPSSFTPTPTPTSTPAYTPSPTSTTSTSSAPATSPSPASTNNSRKWGLAWANDNEWLANFATLPNVGYLYTWSPYLPSDLSNYPNINRMAMLWGWDQVNAFQTTVVPGYAQTVMGMNEPNEPSQSYMSPGDAFNLWMKYINPLGGKGTTLVSPACTDDDSGLQWYQEFFKLCDQTPGCIVDVVAFHAYTTSAQHLMDYATNLHNMFGRDIMITEFADQDYSGLNQQATMSQIWDFAGTVRSFVDGTSWVLAAFPFGPLQNLQGVNPLNSLIDGNGNPTDLAYFYFG